ncbi:MAG: gamma-glutamyltransferase family protein [Variibacter sp.]
MFDAPISVVDAAGVTGAHRPTLMGSKHMVVAGHYGAAHAAFTILEAGGNAVDAGVAAGIALGVLQPDIVNVAGVAPIILREGATGKIHTIAGLGGWPRLADAEVLRREHGGHVPDGLLCTVIPAAPDAWITALEQFGTMSFGEVAQAAIRFAEGFPMYPLLADMIALHEADYARWSSSAAIYLPNGKPPKVGTMFHQRDLARTLRYMVDEEKAKGRHKGARDAFYRGDIARTIAQYHERNGGWLRMDDMETYHSDVAPAVTREWNGIKVSTCGAWCQGPTLLQALGMLDAEELRGLGHNSAAYLHQLAEVLKLAFDDRETYYGDPKFVDVPLDKLLSSEYCAERRKLIRADKAWIKAPRVTAQPPIPRDTSYVCVVDSKGNAFSATPSDTSYASPVIPGTGLCPSSRGKQSWCDADHKSVLAPRKRPRLTPNPAFAEKPGQWVLPFGSPGGDVQIQAMLQVLLNVVLFDMPPQDAIEAPRVSSYSFPDSFEPHEEFPGRLNAEARIPAGVLAELRAKGHDLAPWPDWTWRAGSVCAIVADQTTGVMQGGADPRRTSYALGW